MYIYIYIYKGSLLSGRDFYIAGRDFFISLRLKQYMSFNHNPLGLGGNTEQSLSHFLCHKVTESRQYIQSYL